MKPAKSLVLFDIDGTLMRGAGPHHIAALIEGIRRVTGRITTLDGIPTAGSLDRDLIRSMLIASGEAPEYVEAVLETIVKECQASYLANSASDLSRFVCRGVLSRLEELKAARATLALVTGNLSGIGWKKVELAGLRPYFSNGAFAEDGHTRTQLARLAATRAIERGAAARDYKISLIGDHTNDVEAAKANQFQSVAVASGVLSRAELAKAGPDILVDRLEDLETERLL